MWPFQKKKSSPLPENISKGGMTARYDVQLKHWVFECEDIEFNLSGIPFDENAFEWAKATAAIIRKLEGSIQKKVSECLEGWPCNKAAGKILCVDLDDYRESKTFDLAFVGDETWGDYGVNVIITDDIIVDVYGGD